MGKHSGVAGFIVGSVVGASVGAMVGILTAPRPGAETRAMAADAVNDAWDGAMDAYERQASVVTSRINDFRPQVDATTDELRAKVDAARERMDQLRSSLSDTVANASVQVTNAVDTDDVNVEVVVDGADAVEVEAETEPEDKAEDKTDGKAE